VPDSINGHMVDLSVSMLKMLGPKPVSALGLPVVYRIKYIGPGESIRSKGGGSIGEPQPYVKVGVNEVGMTWLTDLKTWQQERVFEELGGKAGVQSQLGRFNLEQLGV